MICWTIRASFALMIGYCINMMLSVFRSIFSYVITVLTFIYVFMSFSRQQSFRQSTKCVDQCLPQLSICPKVCQQCFLKIVPLEFSVCFIAVFNHACILLDDGH